MPHTTATMAEPPRGQHAGFPDGIENPLRAFANGLLFALPLWGVIGFVVWSIL